MPRVSCDVAECVHNYGGKCSARSVKLKLKECTDMKCKSFYSGYTIDPEQLEKAAIAQEERDRRTAENVKRFFDYMMSKQHAKGGDSDAP